MDNSKLDLILQYIDAKFEYEFAKREIDSDGYIGTPVTERKIMENLLAKLK